MNFSPPNDARFEPADPPLWPKLDPGQIEMPEDALWQRISTTRSRRQRRRQWLASAAVGVFGLVLGAGLMSPLAPWSRAPSVEQALAAQAPDAASDVSAAAPFAATPASNAHESLRAIDRRLQAAYDRNADADEIRRLWQMRDALLAQPAASEAVAVIEL